MIPGWAAGHGWGEQHLGYLLTRCHCDLDVLENGWMDWCWYQKTYATLPLHCCHNHRSSEESPSQISSRMISETLQYVVQWDIEHYAMQYDEPTRYCKRCWYWEKVQPCDNIMLCLVLHLYMEKRNVSFPCAPYSEKEIIKLCYWSENFRSKEFYPLARGHPSLSLLCVS